MRAVGRLPRVFGSSTVAGLRAKSLRRGRDEPAAARPSRETKDLRPGKQVAPNAKPGRGGAGWSPGVDSSLPPWG